MVLILKSIVNLNLQNEFVNILSTICNTYKSKTLQNPDLQNIA